LGAASLSFRLTNPSLGRSIFGRPPLATDEIELTDSDCPGGPGGFALIVDAHWTAVFRMLYCMTASVHDAEELTQETFLRALRRIDSYQPGTRMKSWLLRIASNACIDLRRRQKRTKLAPLPEDLAGSEQSPGHRLETTEQDGLLRTALEKLSETTRTVFHLRVQESLSFREIAELLGTTEQAARWHMHQARSKLMKHLSKNRD
jgi:RNA polymerase sigma-70 factor, ECF subfamily